MLLSFKFSFSPPPFYFTKTASGVGGRNMFISRMTRRHRPTYKSYKQKPKNKIEKWYQQFIIMMPCMTMAPVGHVLFKWGTLITNRNDFLGPELTSTAVVIDDTLTVLTVDMCYSERFLYICKQMTRECYILNRTSNRPPDKYGLSIRWIYTYKKNIEWRNRL